MCQTCIEKHACQHCGIKLRPTIHTLTSGHVSALRKFRQAMQALNKTRIHARKQMFDNPSPYRLTYDELNNLSKLRIFGLLAHGSENTRSGYWLITTNGNRFLDGTYDSPKQVKTLRGKIVGYSAAKVSVRHLAPKEPEFEKHFNEPKAAQTAQLWV